MANEEQVALLQQSIKVWNKWRADNPNAEIDLHNAEFIKVDAGFFLKTDLRHANLRHADLRHANLRDADLRDADLRDANLIKVDLTNANLRDTNLFNANLFNANLRDANLIRVDLTNANLRNANLHNAKLFNITLSNADLRHANLGYARLIEANLGYANLFKADFTKANLFKANFRNAKLRNAKLRNANLINTNLSHTNLSHTDLREANLSYANLNEADLSHTDLREADLSGVNLRNANLNGANLSGVNLRNADLSGANLGHTILTNTDLFAAQVLYTDFRGATLTGACIADWHIGSSTILENVECDYIFRTYDPKKRTFASRLPVDPASNFVPGEFTQRFQIIASALETIDITFTDGIDWQAFFQSFQELKQQYPNQNIAVQAMEEKEQAFVVRLKVETEATGPELEKLKANIETSQKKLYFTQLALKEAQGKIKVYREMMGVVQTLAGKPMGNQHFHGNVGNVTANNYGKQQINQHNYTSELQSLSGAAKEIKDLLDTLAEDYNTTTETGREKLMKELGREVEKHPKWRRALKEGGIELIKVLCAPIGVPLEMARIYLEEESN